MIDVIEYTDNTRAFDLLESAQMIGVVVPTLRKYLREGKIHGQTVDRRIYIDEAEIKRFKEERERR